MNENVTIDPIQTLPVLPLRDIVIFPGISVNVTAGRAKSALAISQSWDMDNKEIITILQKDPECEDPNIDDLFTNAGTKCIIRKISDEEGVFKILIEGISRVTNLDINQDNGYFRASFSQCKEISLPNPENYKKFILKKFYELCDKSSDYSQNAIKIIQDSSLSLILDTISYYLNVPVKNKFDILCAFSLEERLKLVSVQIMQEIEREIIDFNLNLEVKSQMNKSYRDYYLNERLKTISKMLGHDSADVINLEQEIKNKPIPSDIQEKLLKECKRLASLQSSAPEAAVIRQYIDISLQLPWGIYNKESITVAYANKVLNRSHFGQEKVKERILEYISVVQRTKDISNTPLLCLLGPPGVGKTSIGMSFADAIKRPCARISLGGIRDETEIRGTRRTYIGSMPGTIINKIIQAKSSSPVIILDEIDKISSSDFRGDASSCLLEVLDPALNNSFRDHYLDFAFDLSNVVFIATANSLSSIHPALQDRLEIIELEGYIEKEKIAIANNYIIPKTLKAYKIDPEHFNISASALKCIIEKYTYESGVRSLKRVIEKVARQSILKKLVDKPYTVDLKAVNQLLGEPIINSSMFKFKKDPIGIIQALSWCKSGQGDILPIECVLTTGSGKINTTGNLGDVMIESATAAFTAVKKIITDNKIDSKNFDSIDLHLHFPEGAISKDGPSAGLGIGSVIFSALTNMTIRRDIAITGEITINGFALPVGGLREKLLAALRNKINIVILPKQNLMDIKRIKEEDIKGVRLIYVDNLYGVLKQCLTNPIIF